MKITLVIVGKIKGWHFKDAIKEYSKRLSHHCKLEIIQVVNKKTPDGADEALEKQIKKKEGQRILPNIKGGAYVVALAIEGRILPSEELVLRLQEMGVDDTSQITFVTSGSLGPSEAVMKRVDYALSPFRMTFPHQLTRAVLLEQIYRGYRIIGGEPYHK